MLRRRLRPTSAAAAEPLGPPDGVAGTALLATFMIVATAAWLATSGNGRYATPLLLLLGPLIFMAARASLGRRAALQVCVVLLLLQGAHGASTGNPRWSPHPWAARWFAVSVPEELKREPQLFVSLGKSSESYLAALVHPDSAFVNPIGLTQLAQGAGGWERFIAMRDRFKDRTQIIMVMPTDADKAQARRLVRTMQDVVDRLGLRIDEAACLEIRANGPVPIALSDRPEAKESLVRRVMACRARPLVTPSPSLAATRTAINTAMDGFAAKCPGIFAPMQRTAEAGSRYWTRFYGKHDLDLTVDAVSGVILYGQERQAVSVEIGRLSSWQADVERFECRLPHGGARDISTLSRKLEGHERAAQ